MESNNTTGWPKPPNGTGLSGSKGGTRTEGGPLGTATVTAQGGGGQAPAPAPAVTVHEGDTGQASGHTVFETNITKGKAGHLFKPNSQLEGSG